MKRWIYTASLAGLLALSSASAQAATFTLGDHPDGAESARGDYGIRLDGVWNSLFSVAGATLTYDPGNLAAGATITGIVTLSDSTNGSGDTWTLTYNLTGLSAYNGGFKATGGSGTLVDTDGSDSDAGFDLVNLAAKQDGSGIAFYFAPDGFRLCNTTGGSVAGCYAGFSDTDWVGNGWLMGTYSYYSYQYNRWKTKEFGGSGSNDFLFTAKSDGDIPDVPEPSTMLLTMGGVALLWFRKRRS